MNRTQSAVDHTQTTMQNILLQEMEEFEEILIATNNLSGSLDRAFERILLFNIHFDRLVKSARQEIWKSKIPSLSDSDRESLAAEFELTGGEIDNVAIKYLL